MIALVVSCMHDARTEDHLGAFIRRDLHADVTLCPRICFTAYRLSSAHAHAVSDAGESFVLLCAASIPVPSN